MQSCDLIGNKTKFMQEKWLCVIEEAENRKNSNL